jgi:hypothetical protein
LSVSIETSPVRFLVKIPILSIEEDRHSGRTLLSFVKKGGRHSQHFPKI